MAPLRPGLRHHAGRDPAAQVRGHRDRREREARTIRASPASLDDPSNNQVWSTRAVGSRPGRRTRFHRALAWPNCRKGREW